MRRTPRNLRYHELVGLIVTVVTHTDESLINVSGRVVGETKNMLKLLKDGKLMHVPKNGGVFTFKLEDGTNVLVDGDALVGRPEDRMRRLVGG
ncbi:MAG: ribonuclease P protein subunit [Zestosphaera sp.]